jgi:hypothetical protein
MDFEVQTHFLDLKEGNENWKFESGQQAESRPASRPPLGCADCEALAWPSGVGRRLPQGARPSSGHGGADAAARSSWLCRW